MPSINSICSQFDTTKETVVKAYKILKEESLIESKPGKGYFLINDNIDYKPSILLMLDSLNPYMEVLYNAFKKEVGDKYSLDLYFHHNNIDVFKTLLKENRNRYHSFVIKPFLDHEIANILEEFDDQHLIILDRQEFISINRSFVCQDFQHGFYTGLTELTHQIKYYKKINYVHSAINPHPIESEHSFTQYVIKNHLNYSIIPELSIDNIDKNNAYVVVSDDDMILILKKAQQEDWVLGDEVGIIIYNETPLHEFIAGGITTISTDFEEMGRIAAKNAKSRKHIQEIIPTKLFLRSSL